MLDAPQTTRNFIALARKGFFNGCRCTAWCRTSSMQDGDPRGDGEGGPGYTIRDELNERPYVRGTVGMALSWKDTGGSQFFITHSPQPHLDGRYTAFGHVVNGMDVVDRIQVGDVIRANPCVGWEVGVSRDQDEAYIEKRGDRAPLSAGAGWLSASSPPFFFPALGCRFLGHWLIPPFARGFCAGLSPRSSAAASWHVACTVRRPIALYSREPGHSRARGGRMREVRV